MSRNGFRWMALAALTAGAAWAAPPLTVVCTPGSLPVLVGSTVAVSCAASGGTGPYAWTISSGALPPVLSLDPSTGSIAGTLSDPAGPYNFTVTATDSAPKSASGSQTFTGTTADPLSTVLNCVPTTGPVEVGVAYTATCTATGGVQPFSWSIIGQPGFVPAGMTITPGQPDVQSATITLTPSAPMASYNFHVHVTDSFSPPETADGVVYSGAIVPAVAITTTSPLPPTQVGIPYSVTFNAADGVLPYTWSATNPPAGLTLSPAGVLSGTPTTAGTVSFPVTVTDGAGGSSAGSFSLTVNSQLAITNTSPLPAATIGQLYSDTFTATGGSGGYTWSISGQPSWLGIDTATGVLSGTPPSNAVTASFTVTVTDSAKHTANGTFALPVNLIINTSSPLPGGTVGAAYPGATLSGSGGAPPYTWSVTSGSLPGGLSLNGSTGAITGTPSAAGTFSFTIQLADSASGKTTKNFSLTVVSGLTITTPPTLPTGTVGNPYSETLNATGGSGVYTWSVASGSLPAGLSLSGSDISGTPTAAAPANFTIQVKDSANVTASKAFTLTIAAGLSITTSSPLPSGEAGIAYSQTLAVSGGTPPYTWSITAGGLPSGLSPSPAGAISGTPTAAGTFTFKAGVTDSNSVTASKEFTLVVAAAISISTPGSLAGGSVGSSYSQTLVAANGLPPYSWKVTAGALPGGLSLSGAGDIAGSPTTPGTFNFTAQVSDSAGASANRQFTIVVVAGLTVASPATLPTATANGAYNFQFQASGGNPPYSWSIATGSLPSGLSLSTSGVVSGVPSAVGSFPFTVRVTDNASAQASAQVTLAVAPVLTITTASLPDGALGVAYSQSVAASGGTPPYSFSLSAGGLPPGLTLSSAGAVSGTPVSAGIYDFTVKVTDSLALSFTKPFRIAVASKLAITTANLPGAVLNTPYTQGLAAAGGTPPYAWSLGSGSLPPGLTLLSNGGISGTPTATGTFTFNVQAADSASLTATKQFTLAVVSGLTITTPAALPGATVDGAYSQTLAAAGGTAPYTWAVTSGSLPAGVTLSAAGVLSGTPTATGTTTFTVQVTDSASEKTTQQFTLIVASGLTITTTSLPTGKIASAYSQALAAAGGTSPYTWSIASGTLPGGIALAANGTLSGTPSVAGNFNLTVQVTDNASTSATSQLTLVIAGIATPSPLHSAAVGVAYSQTLDLAGGVTPYHWSIVKGALPAGLSLDPTGGTIAGTPTAAGTFPITVQVTDNSPATYSAVFTLTVLPAPSGSFTGIPSSATAATQLNIGLALTSAFASDITGKVTLSFQPDASLGAPSDDPSIQFSTGGRTASFTIPSGSTAPVSFSLQTGTVAGSIGVSVSWQADGADLQVPADLNQTIKIAPAAPVVSNVAASTSSSGLQVQVTAYSTTRELTQAAVHFTATAGQTLQTTDVTVPLTSAANAWFQSGGSAQYGGQFILTLPFAVSGGSAGAIASVSVTLTNTVGTSNSASGSLK